MNSSLLRPGGVRQGAEDSVPDMCWDTGRKELYPQLCAPDLLKRQRDG